MPEGANAGGNFQTAKFLRRATEKTKSCSNNKKLDVCFTESHREDARGLTRVVFLDEPVVSLDEPVVSAGTSRRRFFSFWGTLTGVL
ncbi:MAG TPA: hypothetical protein VI756_21030 [Blastocatellia bacterium]